MTTIIIISLLGIFAMMAEVFKYKNILWYVMVGVLPLVLCYNLSYLGGIAPTWGNDIDRMYAQDNYFTVFSSIIIFLVWVWFLVTKNTYHQDNEFNTADHYALILFSSVGGMLLAGYKDMTMLFMGVEILSIPLYILAGSRKKDLASNESALKYFIMGAFATGVMLFGITFIYGAANSFELTKSDIRHGRIVTYYRFAFQGFCGSVSVLDT
jgi:NADH-quinone oxidoreductase subunit N